MKSFLLVDDHVVVRSGVKGLITGLFAPAEIDEASNGEEAVTKLKKKLYDLVIMDVQMPQTDALSLVEFICFRSPSTPILIFSMSAEKIYAPRFLKAGAKGFVSKEASLDELVKAINLVFNGRTYISENLAVALAEENISGKHQNPFKRLSQREFEIASLLLNGKSPGEISKSLNLQSSTVGTHKARLFEKLGISNLLELKELAVSFNF
jgi:two-component system, NarL family, invasion response regulator UvrY